MPARTRWIDWITREAATPLPQLPWERTRAISAMQDGGATEALRVSAR